MLILSDDEKDRIIYKAAVSGIHEPQQIIAYFVISYAASISARETFL